MDGSELAVLAAYQNNLVSAENDDVTSGSMSPENTTLHVKELKELFHVFFKCVCCVWVTEACAHIKSDYFYS